MFKLNGKLALVTGSSRGIGRAIALEMAKSGADVAVCCSSGSLAAEEVCEQIRALGRKAVSYRCDVSRMEQCAETVKAAVEEFGQVDILVNNAGITRDNLMLMMKEEDFDAVISTNLKGAFNMMKQAGAHFLKRKQGTIINISSVSGMMGNAGQVNYAAAKAIVDALPTCAASEYLQAKALLDFEYIEFVSFQFDKGTTATPITNIDDYESTMTTYKFRCVPEIKNNFKTKKDLNVFMVLYDGDKYVTSKRHGSAYEPGQTKKLYLGFDANYYMPSGIEEPIVKVFVWDYTTFTPYVAPKLIQKTVVDAGEH